jgi:hypothetical protein
MKMLDRLLAIPRYQRLLAPLIAFAIVFAVSAFSTRECSAQLCGQLGGVNFTQNFNTMAASGSSINLNTLPIGFNASESGPGNNVTYAANDGAASTVNTYSYGTGTNTDRALGELGSTTFQSTLGACFVNNTDHPITSFIVGYTGEQWRLGAADGNIDRLDFQFSTDATSLTTGSWIDVNGLDFSSPSNSGAGAKDGNAAANRTVINPFAITPAAPIQPEKTFFIRWVPDDNNGADTQNDGLAIDDFTLGAAYARGLAGDYNNDERVDGKDYVIFRNLLNQAVNMPNDITPGTVVQQDYNEWRQRFGAVNPPPQGGAGSGSSAAVPEPSASLLLIATASLAALMRRQA